MLQAMMHTEQPDIIFKTKSWLDAEIFSNNYTPLRNYRNHLRGGAFIQYRNDLLEIQVTRTFL